MRQVKITRSTTPIVLQRNYPTSTCIYSARANTGISIGYSVPTATRSTVLTAYSSQPGHPTPSASVLSANSTTGMVAVTPCECVAAAASGSCLFRNSPMASSTSSSCATASTAVYSKKPTPTHSSLSCAPIPRQLLAVPASINGRTRHGYSSDVTMTGYIAQCQSTRYTWDPGSDPIAMAS